MSSTLTELLTESLAESLAESLCHWVVDTILTAEYPIQNWQFQKASNLEIRVRSSSAQKQWVEGSRWIVSCSNLKDFCNNSRLPLQTNSVISDFWSAATADRLDSSLGEFLDFHASSGRFALGQKLKKKQNSRQQILLDKICFPYIKLLLYVPQISNLFERLL